VKIQRGPTIITGKSAGFGKGSGVTGAKGFVWLSGSTGIDFKTGNIPESPAEQAKLAMENIKAELEEYGSSLKNIVFWRRYIVGEFPNGIASDQRYQEINNAWQEFWKENGCLEFLRENDPPASTLLGVTALARPEYLLEVEVVAAIE